jgi:hypothetical protein
MNGCCSANGRRHQNAAAVVCALSVFVALIAGSALRPQFAASALPEPGAWTHSVTHAPTVATPVHAPKQTWAGGVSHVARHLPKPFRNEWMTHERALRWASLSPQSDWSPLPDSLAAAPTGLAEVRLMPSATADGDRDLQTLYCILRC